MSDNLTLRAATLRSVCRCVGEGVRFPLLRVAAAVAVIGSTVLATASNRGVTFSKVLPLADDEGVWAYARISPSARFLAYASEPRTHNSAERLMPVVKVVDLSQRATVFTEAGVDAYWSPDESRFIFLSSVNASRPSVSIYSMKSRSIVRDVAPAALGDYFSWANRDGRDLILTIKSNYYYLRDDKGIPPEGRVVPCPDIGTGDRPLISKDGHRITTFWREHVVVRNLNDCDAIVDTGVRGAKADFSWDGRYIALHVPRKDLKGYEIQIVDLVRKTIRHLPELSGSHGSSLFPSWTSDGRLCFRYDSPDYRGFVLAQNVLALNEEPLSVETVSSEPPQFDRLFYHNSAVRPINLVMIWAPWSAHAPAALRNLELAWKYWKSTSAPVDVAQAADPMSRRVDVDNVLADEPVHVPTGRLNPQLFHLTPAINQSPSLMLFINGSMVDQRLGAQSFEELVEWVEPYINPDVRRPKSSSGAWRSGSR